MNCVAAILHHRNQCRRSRLFPFAFCSGVAQLEVFGAVKYRTLFLILVTSAAMLVSTFAGEISLPDYHLAVTLPDSWQQVPDEHTGILVRAQSDTGQLRFMFTCPPVPVQPAPVANASFQNGVKQSLTDQGFTKIIRSEVIKVAGSDAYLCEAAREDRPHSIIQVVWFHEGHALSLVFLSLAKPFKDVPDVQSIIDSVKVPPKS
jgi:hypothetical protein